jgi:hypothetical protein
MRRPASETPAQFLDRVQFKLRRQAEWCRELAKSVDAELDGEHPEVVGPIWRAAAAAMQAAVAVTEAQLVALVAELLPEIAADAAAEREALDRTSHPL